MPSGGTCASRSCVSRGGAAKRGGIGGGIGGIGGGPTGHGAAGAITGATLGARLKSGSNKSINLFFIVALPPLGVNAGASADIPRPLSPPDDDDATDVDTDADARAGASAGPDSRPSSSSPAPSPSTPKMRSRANLYSSSRSSAVRVTTVDADLARVSSRACETFTAPPSPSRVGLARTATRTPRRARSLDSVVIAFASSSTTHTARPTTDDRRPTTDARTL